MPTVASQLAEAVERHQHGDAHGAETLYRAILAHEPDHADALNLVGVLCSQSGRHDEAVALLQRAIEVKPETPKLRYNLGNVLRQKGDLLAAVDAYRAAVSRCTEAASTWFNLGLTLAELDRVDEAGDAFRRAVEADPGHARARHELGLLLAARGDRVAAAEQWQAAIAIDPGVAAYHLNLGLVRHADGLLDDAVACFQQVTSLATRSAVGWCNLGAALRSAGRSDEALVALERSLTLDPRLLSACLNLGRVCLDRGDPTAALGVCRRALAIDPDHGPAHLLLARVLVAAGELEAADEHLAATVELQPADAAVARLRAEVLRRLNRLPAAAAELDRAHALDPASIDAPIARVTLLIEQHELEAATTLAERILHEHPDDVRAVYAAASAGLHRGRAAGAARLLEHAEARRDLTTAERCRVLFKLGEARRRVGRHDEAWSAYQEANDLKGARFDRPAFTARVESIMNACSVERLAELPQAEAGPTCPIFITGVPRSGTTLVEQILDCHPGFHGAGECGLLERIENRLASHAERDEPYPQILRHLRPEDIAALAGFGHELLRRSAGSCRLVGEKSPSSSFYLGLIERLYPDARIVVCTRDPLDTGVSCYFQDFIGALPWSYDLEDTGHYIREHDRLIAHWQRTIRLPIMTLRLEDLIADQEGVTRVLLEFCGLPWDDACLTFYENPRPVQTASADQVRRPLDRRAVGRHVPYARYLEPLRRGLGVGSARTPRAQAERPRG